MRRALWAFALVAAFLVGSVQLVVSQPVTTGPFVRYTPQTFTGGQLAQVRKNLGLDNRYGLQDYITNRPSIVTIVGAQPNETTPSCTSCTVVLDTSATSTRLNNRGWKITTTGAVTAQVIQNYTPTPLFFGKAAAIGMWVYIDPADVGKITQITLDLYLNSGLTISWQRSRLNSSQAFTAGWNLLRWQGAAGQTLANLRGNWGNAYRVRTMIVTNAAVSTGVTIGQVWAEVWPKAQMIFIEDRGYTTFLNSFYPQLKARNIPVEWSLDPALLGTSSGDAQVITEAQVAALALENRNRIGYHGWDGSVTSSMTADQLRTDSMLAIRWLTARGYGPVLWRSAFVQNSATNHTAIQPYHIAYATPSGSSAQVTAWPHPTPYNIDRFALHGQTTTTLDDVFELLELTRGLFVVYTHGVQTASTSANDITPSLRDYFLLKLDASQSWLEGTTFYELFLRDGGRIERGAVGEDLIVWRDLTGAQQTLRLP